jgi:hypothetical protein
VRVVSVERFFQRLPGAAIVRAVSVRAVAALKATILPPRQPVTRPVVRRRKSSTP